MDNLINFNKIDVNRGIMHNIIAKEEGQEYASVKPQKTTFAIDDTITETIRERLVTAAGKDSRAFELEIGNDSAGTFFDVCKDMKNMDEKQFIKASKEIAKLLAESQTKSRIPGGVFILLDCTDKKNSKGLYVVIKAELHEAWKHTTTKDGESKIQILKDIFLSPAQRLYKIGILIERTDTSKIEPNKSFTGFLFDEQFRIEGSKPAEYFYKDFLGFSVDKNAKIQTARFFDQTKNFILKNVEDSDKKIELVNALTVEFITNTESTISPIDISRKYFQDKLNDGLLMDLYNQDVANHLPSTIVKDSILIHSQLENKKMFFPNTISIGGKAESFDENVKIIRTDADIEKLKFKDNFTLIAIKGKPFNNA